MKGYVCDFCGSVIKDPYKVKMKEFYLACVYSEHGVSPVEAKRKRKVHICGECFKKIAKGSVE